MASEDLKRVLVVGTGPFAQVRARGGDGAANLHGVVLVCGSACPPRWPP
jgi:hypothetical protein